MAVTGRQRSRDDRHVRHAQIRSSANAPRHRLAFNIEEALRLCSLPGESEGRAYYFRHLRVSGLPDNGDRRIWLDAFQCALTELAQRAVHAKDTVAAAADAVFFRSEEEACETLLHLISRKRPIGAWFWPAVSDSPAGSTLTAHVVGVIEKLRSSPASWLAVAGSVLNAVEAADPVELLDLLPDALARQWVEELGGDKAGFSVGPPPGFPAPTQRTIERALAVLGREDPRVLWLTSLAVVLAVPSDLERGIAVSRAQLVLGAIEPAGPRLPLAIEQRSPVPLSPKREPNRSAAENERRSPSRPPGALHSSHPAVARDEIFSPQNNAIDPTNGPAVTPASSASTGQSATPLDTPENAEAVSELIQSDDAARQDRCFGEATSAAGLYFLLNALRHLKTHEDQFGLRFLAHFFQRVAQLAGVDASDPILFWTIITLAQTDSEEIDDRRVRLWLLKVRRWCWRNGKISVREIVRRPGLVTLTRTDLDVSLSLDVVDIRIRRIGLDIDPGWLPWFGRVVRFHYPFRGEVYA
jgi:hypothetical protein